MEKLYNNFKISVIVTVILIILAVTWIILDYYVIKDAIANTSLFSSLEVLMLNISIIVFIILIISQIVTLIYSFRIALKAKSMFEKSQKEEKTVKDNSEKNISDKT